jgi:hypothetical protein
MKIKYWIPFFLFIIPTPIITYFMWPAHIWNGFPKERMESLIGLCVMWFFVGVTYYSGIRTVLKEKG